MRTQPHKASVPRRAGTAILLSLSMLAGMLSTFVAPATAKAAESPTDTYIQLSNTFYAYVGVSENLDVNFTKEPLGNIGTGDATVVVTSPDGTVTSCNNLTNASAYGTTCDFTNLTSTVAGIWTVEFVTTGPTDFTSWDIDVQTGNTDIPGRVWVEQYAMLQNQAADFSLYYVSAQGFKYEANYLDYHGINSQFFSDAAGNTLATGSPCTSAYLSYENAGPNNQNGSYDTPANCGDAYKIFFEPPATDLPATSTLPDGSTEWIDPPVVLPNITTVDFAQNGVTDRSGTFSIDVADFEGQMVVEIDANGDGDYTDPEDVTLPLGIVGGVGSVVWDGLDGLGNPVPYSTDITARGHITRVGEIHFTNFDVELRGGGLEVTKLNGPQAGDQTLYWDDTQLPVAGRACSTPVLDGTGGVDSAGGVHQWTCMVNTNDGVSGSWGDTRDIDDWTYHTLNEIMEIALPGLPELEIQKTSTATSEVRVGDTVTYTLDITNNGPGDYTALDPARVQDDLTGVLDDATYNRDAAATTGTVSYAQPRITWEGELAAGDTVRITYSVTLTGEGDLSVDNVVFQTVCDDADPNCNPPTPPQVDCVDGGVDPVTGLPCDESSFELPKLAVTKTADTTQLPADGGVVTYTVTATNTGQADYTAARPAIVLDDLTEVLDDATLDTATLAADLGQTPSFSAPIIRWAGALAVGQTVTITYRVTYDADLGGDTMLNNVAFGPQCASDDPDCDEPQVTPQCDPADANGLDPVTGDPCGRVEIPGARLNVTKDVTPADGSTVVAGDQLTYTITFDSTGTSPADVVNWRDYLAGTLDDASIVSAPVASDPALTVSAIANGEFSVDGVVPNGDSYTVTYTVEVLPDGQRGDNQLGNFILTDGQLPPGPDEECLDGDPLCTVHYVPEIVDSKTSDPVPGSTVEPGDEIEYTLTFENVGTGAGTVDRVDDLNHVLDDADVTVAPVASDAALTVSAITDGRFSINGQLAAGQTVTVTYTVTVREADDMGDATLANFLLDPDEETPDEPECEDTNEDCTDHFAPKIIDSKTSDPVPGTTVVSGELIEYTLTFTNEGAADGTVDRVDDLTHVLDDAVVTVAPVASDAALTVSAITDGRFSINGLLTPGQTVTVTYTVEVDAVPDLGDTILANFLMDPDEETPEEPVCEEDDEDCTDHVAPKIVDSKSVEPESGTSVRSGDQLTYTLTFVNEGAGEGTVDRVDDLNHVLDDAEVIDEPETSDSALAVSGIVDGRYSITGVLAAGQTVTVTYTVQVDEADELGDTMLANFLIDPDEKTPEEPVCTETEDCTYNPVSDIVAAKSANPESRTTVDDGETVTYTLSFENVGEGTGAVNYLDYMTGVLDDADLVDGPVATAGLSAQQSGDQIVVTGELAGGATATVTYTVQVREWENQGDHLLENFLTLSGQAPADECEEGSRMCTEHPILEPVDPTDPTDPVNPGKPDPIVDPGKPARPSVPMLPNTGAGSILPLLLGLGLLASGGLVLARRRRSDT